MKKVGLLIVNYNDSQNTINLIKSVDNFAFINKIVVVDNKSTDNSLEKLSSLKSKKLHIIKSENKGYNHAINIGSKYLIQELKECYIIISNSDIVINNEEVIKSLIASFKENIACVMPKVLEHDNFIMGWRLLSANQELLISIPFLNRLYRNKLKNYKEDYYEHNDIIDVVHGSFFVIDSQVLEEINYMDSNVFLYYEENILARKLQKVNKLSVINKDVYVEHKHNQSIGNNVTHLNKYKIYKKSQLYYEKNYNNANSIQMLLFKLFYYIGLLGLKIKSLLIK